MFPEPTELLLIGYLIESNWTPKSKSNTLTECMTCWTGCRIPKNIWSMKVVLQSHGETLRLRIMILPVLLMNCQWSREQKWKRVRDTHFPKHRNCEICQRTKITRAPCRRRIAGAVPRAEKIGVLTTADHKVLSEGSESRNNHRYAVVVQDLATQWLQSYPCKTKNSQETQKSPMKLLEPTRKPKVIYTDNSLEFGTSCEQLS